MELGANIEMHRKQSGLTTVELAAAAGIRPQYISQIENGKRSPSLKILRKIAAALNTTTSELLGEVGESCPVKLKKLIQAAESLNPQQLEIVISVVKEISGSYEADKTGKEDS